MLPLGLLSELDRAEAEFDQTRATLVTLKAKEAAEAAMGKREKEATRTAW